MMHKQHLCCKTKMKIDYLVVGTHDTPDAQAVNPAAGRHRKLASIFTDNHNRKTISNSVYVSKAISL